MKSEKILEEKHRRLRYNGLVLLFVLFFLMPSQYGRAQSCPAQNPASAIQVYLEKKARPPIDMASVIHITGHGTFNSGDYWGKRVQSSKGWVQYTLISNEKPSAVFSQILEKIQLEDSESAKESLAKATGSETDNKLPQFTFKGYKGSEQNILVYDVHSTADVKHGYNGEIFIDGATCLPLVEHGSLVDIGGNSFAKLQKFCPMHVDFSRSYSIIHDRAILLKDVTDGGCRLIHAHYESEQSDVEIK